MDAINHLIQNSTIRAVVATMPARLAGLVDLAVTIQQIPAPTFAEAERAAFVQSHLVALGLTDVYQDELHNVYGRLRGQRPGTPVVISAHLDTVFAAETNLTVRRETQLVHGPGIADNSMGVAGLLILAELLQRSGLRPQRDIWFVANVCEEGLGDLRGMRAVVERFGRDAAAYIILEGGVYGHIFHQAIAVRRYHIEITTPGGHSWGNFGTPSAIHLLGRLITTLDQIQVPDKPRTTYNVGKIEGGTTINTIAAQASLLLDCRSEDNQALANLLNQVQKAIATVSNIPDVQVKITSIGDRPAGYIRLNHPLIKMTEAALRQSGCTEVFFSSGSTDANIPLSQGLPAVCIGLAQSHNAHRLDEYLDITNLSAGMVQLFLLTLAAAAFSG
ncbi:MAG: M20/M25/M40 family metallo-hydrolase [Chloroflexi bacterium]|nr:M20/M25/M40 family metallo-hydrolase [Chloroflexota bacterium]MBP8055021.1 M20/M25/M40 family metallo-hydrolase [Chloroflexota bacterium]